MNFLMRTTTHVYSDREKPSSTAATTPTKAPAPTIPEPRADGVSSLESLIAEDPYLQVGRFDGVVDGENGALRFTSKNDASVLAKHLDVSEEEGWITIPYSMSFNAPTNSSFLLPCLRQRLVHCFNETGN